MTLEHGILGLAIIFFLGCLLYAWLGFRKSTSVAPAPVVPIAPGAVPVAPVVNGTSPALQFFMFLEAQGKAMAAQQLANLMASQYAAQHTATLQAAMAPSPVPNPPSVVVVAPSSSPAPPINP